MGLISRVVTFLLNSHGTFSPEHDIDALSFVLGLAVALLSSFIFFRANKPATQATPPRPQTSDGKPSENPAVAASQSNENDTESSKSATFLPAQHSTSALSQLCVPQAKREAAGGVQSIEKTQAQAPVTEAVAEAEDDGDEDELGNCPTIEILPLVPLQFEVGAHSWCDEKREERTLCSQGLLCLVRRRGHRRR